MANYYWTMESWSDAYPPENASEIIEWANGVLAARAAENPAYDEEGLDFISETLWDTWSRYDDTIREILENGNYASAVELMDDEIREAIHRDIAPCSEYIFLLEYMFRHFRKYRKEFTI